MNRFHILRALFILGIGLIFIGGTGVDQVWAQEGKQPVEYVNPFIGTGVYKAEGVMGEGNTFPGPSRPHGMVQLSPDTDFHFGGYMYHDDHIQGFSHTHVTGTGCGGFGNILVMPGKGKPSFYERGYRSSFSHDSEKAEPGYYGVKLEDSGVRAELTSTKRVGFHKYTLPDSGKYHIILDISHNLENNPDHPVDGSIKVKDKRTLTGFVTMPYPFCNGQTPYTVYFAMKLSKSYDSYGTWSGGIPRSGNVIQNGSEIGAYLNYKVAKPETVMVKVGISYVSEKQAMLNLETEISHWNFDQVREESKRVWNEKLSRIQVKGGSKKDKVKFYTSLYHAMLGPYTWSDADGKYLGMDNKVHTAEDYTHYHFFSLWDTFRSQHPLLTLIEPKVQNDVVRTLVDRYRKGGWLPKWEFAGRYTNTMIADHAVSVIGDTYMKKIRNYDMDTAYRAMLKSANRLPRQADIYVARHKEHFSPLFLHRYGRAATTWFADGEQHSLSFDWRWKYNDQQWHHFAVSYESEEQIGVYVDGKLVAERSHPAGPLDASSFPWFIGSDGEVDEWEDYFTGEISDFRLYDAALEQEGIQKIRKGERIESDPLVHYPMNEQPGETVENSASPNTSGLVKGGITGASSGQRTSFIFDGLDDAVVFAKEKNLSPARELTCSFWIKTSLPTDYAGRKGLDHYLELGYVPYDVNFGEKERGSVSITLENSYNDWVIAQVAGQRGDESAYKQYMKRSKYYRNLFDSTSGFFRPKKRNGDWKPNYDPRHWAGFTEGNSWTYSWFVPHDVKGLIDLMGREKFIDNLDHFFEEFITPGWHELFSHYWHGNEPSQQVPYYYNFVGQPWKTQRVTRDIMGQLYGAGPSGISGNDDVGQLSAWFALSAMGIHPVAPGRPTYQISSPLFEQVTMKLDSAYYPSDSFVIKAEGSSDAHKFIQSAAINGNVYQKPWIEHKHIRMGDTLSLKMGPKPNKSWGTSPKHAPQTWSPEWK